MSYSAALFGVFFKLPTVMALYLSDAFRQVPAVAVLMKRRAPKVTGEIAGRTARARELRRFADRLEENGTVTEFDEVLWSDFVDYVTVDSKKRMTFTFRDGTDITV